MERRAREHGYSRRHRFTARGAFGPVLRGARRVRGETVVIHVLSGRSPASRLGVALTRRLVPSAVHRSLLKRIVREAFRRHPVKRAGLDCVVALRQRFAEGSLAAIRDEVGRLFDELARTGER